MTSELEFDPPAARWVRVRRGDEKSDPPFEVDPDGFLPAPSPWSSQFSQGDLIRPEDADRSGALVLLGEPGAGKTTTFGALTDARPESDAPQPGEPGTLWLTGSELSDRSSFTEFLGEHLMALPESPGPETPLPELTVVLDQLDESPDIRSVHRYFQHALSGRDTRSLRLLIACRTADYPVQLTEVLNTAGCSCVIADLAPMTRGDVDTLVAGVGVDAPAFMGAVAENGVGSLASVPLTLKVLLAAYRDLGGLSGGPLALFERGVTRLAEEHDVGRTSATFSATSVGQRLAIAGRVATRLVLSGQRAIRTGSSANARERDVTDGSISGGEEDADSGQFSVTSAAVSETLKAALFTGAGRDLVAFAHSSFAAFLAARHLASRLGGGAAARQLSGVFLVAAPDEDTASIPVHLRETAAWLLAQAPDEMRWLAAAGSGRPDGTQRLHHRCQVTGHTCRRTTAAGRGD